MNLAKDIAYLLYKHNCVIIPNFGAFLVNEKKAERNQNAKFANPKSKAISFNAQVKNNDGLLANYLSNKNLYSYERGIEEIQTYVTELNEKLKSKRNAEVSEVGTFYLTKEEKLIFVPYHSVNFEITSFGLPKLRLKTVQTSVSAVAVKTEPIPVKIIEPIRKVEPTIVAKAERKIEVQEKKRAIKLEEKLPAMEAKRSSLVWINILGTLLIVAIASGIAHFEFTNNTNATNAYADLLDTPTTVIDKNITSTEDLSTIEDTKSVTLTDDALAIETPAIVKEPAEIKQAKYKLNLYSVCTQPQTDTLAAEKLKIELSAKFPGAFVWKENENYRVQIIALSKEKLAIEFKEMAQRKTKQNLVIKQK
jgi:nucleoid DNA-binding protein